MVGTLGDQDYEPSQNNKIFTQADTNLQMQRGLYRLLWSRTLLKMGMGTDKRSKARYRDYLPVCQQEWMRDIRTATNHLPFDGDDFKNIMPSWLPSHQTSICKKRARNNAKIYGDYGCLSKRYTAQDAAPIWVLSGMRNSERVSYSCAKIVEPKGWRWKCKGKQDLLWIWGICLGGCFGNSLFGDSK